MNIIPLCYPNLVKFDLAQTPIRVSLAAATGYLFGAIAGSSSLEWARVGVITAIAHEALFLLRTIVKGDSEPKSSYALLNGACAVCIGVYTSNWPNSEMVRFILLSTSVWSTVYGLLTRD